MVNSKSVAVQQFLEIVRGELPVRAPANEFQTVRVEAVERYCLKCCAARMFDAWHGQHGGAAFTLGRCRACGKEVTL